MTTKEDIRTRASINAIGNGVLGGSMGNAGTSTGLHSSMGADTSQDACNCLGDISADTRSHMPMQESCDSGDFAGRQSHESAAGRMGSLSLGD